MSLWQIPGNAFMFNLRDLIPNAGNKFIFDKEAAQIFVFGASDHCPWQGASENQKFAAKPTRLNMNLFPAFGIT